MRDSGDVDFTTDVREGVVVREGLTGSRIAVGALSLAGPSRIGLAARGSGTGAGGSFAVELFLPAGAGGGATGKAGAAPATRVERAELLLPGRAPLAAKDPRAWTVTWTKLDASRGGAVDVDLAGAFDDASGHVAVRAHVTTYVRDVVRPAEGAGGAED
jgi:hypothetical protein